MVDSTFKIAKMSLLEVPSKYACSKLISDLIADIPEIYNITLPTESNLGYVAASQNAPDSGEAILWVSLDGSGTPLTINYFVDGAWRAILNLRRTPQWFNGNYKAERDRWEKLGYVLADGTNGGANISHLFKILTEPTINYSVWAMYFVGQQILRSDEE